MTGWGGPAILGATVNSHRLMPDDASGTRRWRV